MEFVRAPASLAVIQPLPPRLRLLGGCELLPGDSPALEFPYDKIRLLLAVLALEARPLPRERLAELLWPQSEAEQARANLRRALFDLRGLLRRAGLSDEALLSDKKQLALNPAIGWQLDCREFQSPLPALSQDAPPEAPELQALEARLDLYRGPLLDGLDLDGLPNLQEWLSPQREALAHVAGRLARRLSQGWEQAGRTGRALSAARRGLLLDPWNEALLRTCMRLQSERERPAALAQFEQFRQRLADLLGLAPEAETLALAEQLRRASTGSVAAPAHPSERRRIVALACELEPASCIDPEALSRQLPALQQQLREALLTHGGFVLRAEGGELLAFFGHPRALEQAPRRALAAALALQACLGSGPSGSLLCPRLGLEAGWVYADPRQGSPDGAGTLSRQARRLALLAGPGEIRLGPSLSAQDPAGFALQPLDDGGALLQGRARTSDPSLSRPMVGRQRELTLLMQAWRQRDNQPQALLVQAEPGLGKTRLLQALMEQCAPGPEQGLQLNCLPEYQHSPYHPFIACLQQRLSALQALHGESPTAAQRRLLTQAAPSLAALQPRLERLLQGRARAHGEEPDPAAEPDRHADESLLLAALGLGSPEGPQLLVIEDLHWADPSSLSLLARLLRQGHAPGLVVLSSRDPAPAVLPALPCLALEPLPPSQMQRLISQLALSDATQAEAVLRRAEGVPLYAEELARALQQAPDEPMPARLWDLLAARLEQVGAEARRLAQAASVIGTRFELPLLHWLHEEADAVQQSALLQELLAAGLVRVDQAGWGFRHALLRDAAYQSLAPSPRRALHRRLAEGLRGPFAGLGAEAPELLAAQLASAEDGLAAHYWLLAARRAAALSAHVEACHHFRQGLAALALPGAPAALALPLELGLGYALMATEGYGSQTARHHFQQVLALADRQAEDAARFQALWGLWMGSRSGEGVAPAGPAVRPGIRPLALRQAQGLMDEARRQRDAAASVQAAYALGNNHLFLGRLGEAGRWLERASSEARGLNAGQLLGRFGEHGGVTAAGLRAWVLALQGRAEQAQQQAEQTVAAARLLRHAHTEAYALATAAVMHQRLRQPVLAERRAEELRRLAEAHDMVLWQAVSGLVGGWARAVRGEAGGLAPIRQAVAMAAVAMPSTEATFLSLLADALVALHQPGAALGCLDEALAKAHQRQEDYLEPELWRLRALALAQQGGASLEIRRSFARSLWRARQMGAGLLQLRTLTCRMSWQAATPTLRRSLARRLQRLPGLATLADGREAAAQAAAFNAGSTMAL